MGLKVDASFLRFLTMGAVATKTVVQQMRDIGLMPVELERQSTSNKIWSTKVKRLRLPDLLCVRTGVRVEVRAKSRLEIRMSDAPDNPDRVWDAGLYGDDLIAFVKCVISDLGAVTPESVELFSVRDINRCDIKHTKLGPAKSASEGSERDRVWPTIVPNAAGIVVEVTPEKIVTLLDSGRRQSYGLRGHLHAYVRPQQRFAASTEFLAGLPRRKSSLPSVGGQWNPRPLLLSRSNVDRYVAVKALGFIGTCADVRALLELASASPDPRVGLEAAGALARLGDDLGLAFLAAEVSCPRAPYLRMEAVLILAELSDSALRAEAASILVEVARSDDLIGDEVREAAIWGLGYAGLKAYKKLVQFLDVPDARERIHALVALGDDFGAPTIRALVGVLADASTSRVAKSSAAEALTRTQQVDEVLRVIMPLAIAKDLQGSAWARIVLGALPKAKVDDANCPQELAEVLLPLQLLSPGTNWTRSRAFAPDIDFVRRQQVEP